LILIGAGYDISAESDVLLLDISNDEEYVWTTTFNPSVIPVSPTPTPSSSSDSQLSNKFAYYNTPAMIGAIIGSLIGGILLSFGGFVLYKRNRDKRRKEHGIPVPDDDTYSNHSQEEMLIYSS
jgi:hypothetical protein